MKWKILRWCNAFPKSPRVVLRSPGVDLLTRRAWRNSRRLVKKTSRRVRPGRRSGQITLNKSKSALWIHSSRAYIYVFYFPKKVFTPSHGVCFLLIFSSFECEGLKNKAFTRAAKYSHGRWTLVKGWKSKPSHRETASQSGGNRHQRLPMLWILEISSLHTWSLWKSEGNTHRVKGWMLFSGIKKRIEERE